MTVLVCIASLLAVAYLGYHHYSYKSRMMDRQEAQLLEITRKAARDIDHLASEVMRNATAVADDLSAREAGDAVQKRAEQRLQQMVASHPTFYGATIIYLPYAFRKDLRLYSAYYFKKNEQVVFERLDRVYDYSNGKYPWYTAALEKGSGWSEPYFDDAAKTLMITYSALFYATDAATGKRVAKGMVTIDVSLDGVRKIVESLPLGVGGYGGLVSASGTYLYHPTREYAATGKTILDIAEAKHDDQRRFLGEMLRGQQVTGGILDHVSVTTGLPSWLAYEPVPSAHWLLINTFIKEDVPLDNDRLRRQLLLLTCFAVLFLVSAAFLVLHHRDASAGRLWLVVAITTLLLAVGITSVWFFALEYDAEVMKGTPVVHMGELDELARKLDADAKQRNAEAPVYIPTGVLIESLRFADGNDIIFSGQAWQRIGKDAPEGLIPGFNLLSAEDVKTTEIYRQSADGQTLVRWQVQGRIRQNLRHARYPFEREDLTFKLVAKDLNHRVILVPDLDSYVLNNPAALPGLEQGLPLPGWEIEKSFFDLSKRVERLSLGMGAENGSENDPGRALPVLRFNVVVKKHFLDSFVSNQFPLIVVSMMLFALLVTTTTEERLCCL